MFLVSLLLITNLAQAGISVEGATDDDRRTCKSKTSQKSPYLDQKTKDNLMILCLEEQVNKHEVNRLHSKITKLSDTKQECYGNRRSASNFWMGDALPSQAAIDTCNEANKKIEAEIEDKNKNLATLSEKLTKSADAFNRSNAEAKITETQRMELDNIVNDEFTNMKLSIFDSRLRNNDAALNLEKMSRALDNSAMGLYLRDRMAGLLNSEVMCSAVKACPEPRNIKGKDLNSIFNSKMTTSASDVSESSNTPPAPTAK